MLTIKNDGIYDVTEFHNMYGQVTNTKEELVIAKEAFMLAYNEWIRPHIEWERRLP